MGLICAALSKWKCKIEDVDPATGVSGGRLENKLNAQRAMC